MIMLRKTALSEVPVGTTFEAWNHKYTVLNKEDDKVFVLAAEIETRMQFHDNGKSYEIAPNDFRDSNIRDWLNDDYLGILKKNGLKDDDILDLEIDLKCTLGQHEYGKDKVKVGLLTLEEYGKYYDVIPCVDDLWWWLATPYKTPSYLSNNSIGTNIVWAIDYDNDYFSDSCHHNEFGVRPTLNISPSLLVTWDDKSYTKDKGDWDEYIKYLHKWATEHSDKFFVEYNPVCYYEWKLRYKGKTDQDEN